MGRLDAFEASGLPRYTRYAARVCTGAAKRVRADPMLILCVLLTTVFLLIPVDALAWGPITHIVHGSSVLANLQMLPAALQSLLEQHPDRYLYGCVGADIIQAKAYTRNLADHCHRWPLAWRLVGAADSDCTRAFAWGYMTHLAADIISHNHFVPSRLLQSYDRRSLGHAYWEARADALQRYCYWERTREVLAPNYRDCDELVDSVAQETLFSFKTNKRIFDSLMGINKLERWKRLVDRVNRRSRFAMAREEIEDYNRVCVASALDLLTNKERSFTQAQDATGRDALTRAIRLRRRLRTLKKRGTLDRQTEQDLLEDMVPGLDELTAPTS